MRYFVPFAVALLATTAPAYAQDTDADPNFTGIHAEAIAGLDYVKGGSASSTGVAYGGNVGYDFATGGVVLGVEGEAAFSSNRRCGNNVIVVGDRLCEKAGRDLYAGARIGVIVGKKTMLYVKGGYTNARDEGKYTSGTTTVKVGDNLDGVRGGVGVETDINHLVVKVEYRYSNYEQDVVRHQGVVGIGFRF